MKRQNAIKWLKDYRKNTDFEMPQYEEALEMAIKALSQEPCDDAISREKALNIACQCGIWAVRAIENLPSVTHKSGKWIVDSPHYVCSECNYVHHLQRFEVMSGCKLGNFCPNCGSAMKDGRTLDEFIEDSKESEDEE